ncbi:MAG: inorganic diphosphatase [Flavobacteriales bacterium]|nr:inorganic diphosphatase [Flavobacteriales bacterium]
MERLAILVMCISLGCVHHEEDKESVEMRTPETLVAEPAPGPLNAVIEIPAGTVEKREYDPATGTFPISHRNGKPRLIRFLPYPANYGFIPGTLMDADDGGDGDALDVFVLCGAVPAGTVLGVVPIGIIELLDAGERDDKLLALPADPSLRTIDAGDLDQLPEGVQEILVTWLLNYDPEDGAELLAVKGRAEALAAVARWRTKTN